MTLANFNPEIEAELRGDPTSPWFDDQYGGSGFHEMGPTTVYPGDVRLDDPEDSDMNDLAACVSERRRLQDLAPEADTWMVGKSIEAASVDPVRWQVSIHLGKAIGVCYAPCGTTTLREACDCALAKFRAELLDHVEAAEAGQVAA